ncbi:MAG: OB-fold domain-containing protein [Betaproteobacteria bacterium]|jgi:uncharacterized protein
MTQYFKPLPVIDDTSSPFWKAAKNKILQLPKCSACNEIRIQFERWCPNCSSEKFTWEKLSGEGTVWSHCIFYKKYFNEFENEIPYNVVLIKLKEGPKIISNLIDIESKYIKVGLPVSAYFEDVTNEITLIKFKSIKI